MFLTSERGFPLGIRRVQGRLHVDRRAILSVGLSQDSALDTINLSYGSMLTCFGAFDLQQSQAPECKMNIC